MFSNKGRKVLMRPILMFLLFAVSLSAQEQKASTETPSSEGKPASACVIIKRMGPADEITSHLYSFGIRGKQFQYVEGNLPPGISFHGRLTDHDVRKVLDKGGRVQIVEQRYSPADLDAARKQCSGAPVVTTEPGKDSPKQNENTPTSGAASTSVDHPSEPSTKSVPAESATISVSSSPDGADVYADEAFVGNAPATLKLSPGKHAVKVTMAGYKDWSRDITAIAGSEAHLKANLEKLE
jgi:PEGA domain-containing protein